VKELRKRYERIANVYKYMFGNKVAHIRIPNTKVSKIGCFLTTYPTTDYIGWHDFRDGPLTNF